MRKSISMTTVLKTLQWGALGVIVSAALTVPLNGWSEATHSPIHWQPWSNSAFEDAKTNKKLVILDLEAVWCHWCHVMDEKTYQDPAVIKALNDHYVSLKVDQDSRPDLSNRYMDYGWPATIIFDGNGRELVKRSGYIEPAEMAQLLERLAKNPQPEEDQDEAPAKFSESPYLSKQLQALLEKDNDDDYDTQYGSWGVGGHKFMDWDSTEFAMTQGRDGDIKADKRARQTLDQQLQLIDPVWGGVYQYSHGGTWTNPHFEKIMSVQAENMRIYALAYAQYQDTRYLDAANKIDRFINDFMTSPNGAFYTSMDADLKQGEHSHDYFKLNDAERRAQGIPRIDTHIYSRENGWVINSLAHLSMVTDEIASGETLYLDRAKKAANAIIATRSILDDQGQPTGGFGHDEKDAAGPYLGDTLSMGRAFLSLYKATGERDWLVKAEAASKFIDSHFRQANQPGYASAVVDPNAIINPRPLRDENQQLVRFTNLLFHTTGKADYKTMAENAMRYLATPTIARERYAGTTLLADYELKRPPLHVTVVGPKADPIAKALYSQALKYPVSYKRVDWLDRAEGALPNPDVEYPTLEKPAAYVCTNNRCSIPIVEPGQLADRISTITKQAKK